MSASGARILIVSPVRNEAAHIERIARALIAQELPPARWIVIDDGSSDTTVEVLREIEREVPWMTVLESPQWPLAAGTRDRLAMAAAPRNFNAGLAAVDWWQFSHVMKLDGDIELPPSYLRVLTERFTTDPELGLAGGVLVEPTCDGGLRPIKIPCNHVHGALKCYSRECFAAIGGVQERLGWDTIDETYARMRGFQTRSFVDLVSVHHRPVGSADGVIRGRARHGACAYIAHYPLVWVTLRSFKIALSRPRVISGFAFLFGYLRAAALRTDQVPDSAYRQFTRRELRGRIARALTPRGLRPTA